VLQALNLPLIHETTFYSPRQFMAGYLQAAGLPACPEPVMTEKEYARQLARLRRLPPPPGRSPTPWGNEAAEEDAQSEAQRRYTEARAAERRL
jgi:hypothetical protein